jgi:hypothetical protein
MESLLNISRSNLLVDVGVVVVAAIVAIVSFAFLIPLDSVPAITGVSIILGLAYAIAIVAWVIVLTWYAKDPAHLVWLNTHLIFLVLLPATIAATAMNVTSVQNTRNLIAGQVTG